MAVLATTPPTAPKFGKSPLLSGISSRMLLLAGLVAVLPLIAIAIANVYIIQLIDPRLSATGNLGTLIAVDAVALVISISAIVAAVMATARSVTRPVMATASLAESVGRGNLDVAVAPSSRNDQLDMMVRSINDMVGYVREMAAVADRVATGDLTVQVDPRSDSDVFGMAFRRMIQATHRVAADVMQDARAVADATDSLYRASTQAMEAASKIASSVDVSNTRTVEESEMIARIAQGAEDQRRSVLSSSDTISQMSSAIERVAQNAQAVADASGSAYRAATDGAERVKQAAISMNSIRDSVVQSAGQLRQMGNTSKQISSISELIGDIAEQTNLLALNAAIEAARAGEQGKGFAVVADEVRKLAGRTSSATSQISELTTKISIQTQQAIEAMERGVGRVEEGSELAARAAEALQSILMAVRRTNDQIQAISTIAEQMSASSSDVVGAINRISQVVVQSSEQTEQMSQRSRENMAAAEEVQSATRRMTEQVSAIHGAAQQLKQLSASLKEASDSFQV